MRDPQWLAREVANYDSELMDLPFLGSRLAICLLVLGSIKLDADQGRTPLLFR